MVTTSQRICPVCDAVVAEEELGLPTGAAHLEDVLGVPRGFMAERQVLAVMENTEKQLHDHLAGHPPEEWLPVLMRWINVAGDLSRILSSTTQEQDG